MIALNIFRSLCMISLPFFPSIWFIYIAVFIISMGGAVFETSSMAYITKLIPFNKRKRFNALRSLIESGGFLTGPAIAGVLFLIGSPSFAIDINAFALVISGLIIFFLPNFKVHSVTSIPEKITLTLLKNDWKIVKDFSGKSFSSNTPIA